MLRSQTGVPQLQGNMLAMNAQPIFPGQQQPGQSQQPPGAQMGGMSGVGMQMNPLGAQPSTMFQHAQAVQQQQQQRQQQQQQMMMRQAGMSGLGGMAVGQMPPTGGQVGNAMAGMGFPSGVGPPGAGVRRVISQPSGTGGQAMQGFHQGQIGSPVNMGGMGMNAQTSMPAQLRAVTQAQVQEQINLRQSQSAQIAMNPDIAMPMGPGTNRQPGPPGQPGQAGHARSMSAQAQHNALQMMNRQQGPPGSMPQNLPPNSQFMPFTQQVAQQQAPHSRPQTQPSPSHPAGPSTGMQMSPHVPPQSVPGGGPRPGMPGDHSVMIGFPGQQSHPANFGTGRRSAGPGPSPVNPQFPFHRSPQPDGSNQSGQPQSMPDGVGAQSGGPGARPQSFLETPAQRMESMRQGDQGIHFTMSPQNRNIPSRPPSGHLVHQTMGGPSQGSPLMNGHAPNMMGGVPQRPSSQPQPPGASGRSPSRVARVHTPLSAQPGPRSIPPPRAGGPMGPPLSTGGGSGSAGPSNPTHTQHLQPPGPPGGLRPPIIPRPPSRPPQQATPPSSAHPTAQHLMQPPLPSQGLMHPMHMLPMHLAPKGPVSGIGLTKLSQLSYVLSERREEKHELIFWEKFVEDWFNPDGVLRFTLWRENQTEMKPFEISTSILPRFFLVTTQAGVESMSFSFDDAEEILENPQEITVSCDVATWTWRFRNGFMVTMRGPLQARIFFRARTGADPPFEKQSPHQKESPYVTRLQGFMFDARQHDKFISLESIRGPRMQESMPTPAPTPRMRNQSNPYADSVQRRLADERIHRSNDFEQRTVIERGSMPSEPVNHFGIPQATMRCLELAESVAYMNDVMEFSVENIPIGPMDALSKLSKSMYDLNPSYYGEPPASGFHGLALGWSSSNGLMDPAASMFAGPTQSLINGHSSAMSAAVASPQTSSSVTNSPQKQHKTITSSISSNTAPATPSSASAGGGSLKRKNTIDSSSGGSEQPPAKRVTRKRGRTNTNS